MKFSIRKIVLWDSALENKPTEIEFLPNKVNVITGDSNTGKTCVLKIIDYCLFGNHNDVPDVVRENLSFYALAIDINEKQFTIGRPSSRIPGNKYYFSDTGHIPLASPINKLDALVDESVVKRAFEKEYIITEDYELMKVGSRIREGSKLRLQYFSIFNTISQNLILDEENFFDFELNKRDGQLYKEVLDSIFDLCIGMSTKEIYDLRKELEKNRNYLSGLVKKSSGLTKKLEKNLSFIKKLIYQARQLDLVDDEIDENNLEEAFKIIDSRVNSEVLQLKKAVMPDDYTVLDKERFSLKQKIRKLSSLQREVEEYSKIILEREDSLKPIDYLYKSRENLLLAPELNEFMNKLSNELTLVKKSIAEVPSSQINVSNDLAAYNSRLSEIEAKLKNYPAKKEFVGINKRNIALIETRVEIKNFINEKREINESELEGISKDVEYYTRKINELKEQLPADEDGDRVRRINLLNDTIQQYYLIISDCLDEYKDYQTSFNYIKKTIGLVKPNDESPSIISGSSNFLFLQLCLFLGLHELFIKKKIVSNYVPQFLIIDYPSLPYKTNAEQSGTDTDADMHKMRKVFELLDAFITKITGPEYKADFQIIILEHVTSDIWESPTKLKNFHLAKEFRNGEKLLG